MYQVMGEQSGSGADMLHRKSNKVNRNHVEQHIGKLKHHAEKQKNNFETLTVSAKAGPWGLGDHPGSHAITLARHPRC